MNGQWFGFQVARATKKSKWSAEEDAKLKAAVDRLGTESWIKIAACVPGRTGKQCRERWIGQLAPDVTKGSWGAEEDLTLVRSHKRHGNKWTTIAQELPGRSAISVKNRWNWLVRHHASVIEEDTEASDSSPPVLERPGRCAVFDPIHYDGGLFGAAFQQFQASMLLGK